MKKFAILLGMLLLAGFTFAGAVILPSNPVYVQTCCMHKMVSNNLLSAAYNYYIYDDGCASGHQYIMDEMNYLDGLMNGQGGVSDYYYQMNNACSFGASAECQAAQRAFYSNAGAARQEFMGGKTIYFNTARSALASGCGTGVDTISMDISASISAYRSCIQMGCMRPPLPPFPPIPPRPLPPPYPWPPIPRPIEIIR